MSMYSDHIKIVQRFTTEFLGNADSAAADATAHLNIQGIRGLNRKDPLMGLMNIKLL